MEQTEMYGSLKQAQTKVEKRLDAGSARYGTFARVFSQEKIFDVLVQHDGLLFKQDDGINVRTSINEGAKWYKIHPHAMGQICSKVKLPFVYLQHLKSFDGWGTALACENLNTLFKETPFRKQAGEPAKFLLRTVNNTVRGFVSNRYALHLSTTPLLDRFSDYAKEMGAKPIGADWSDIRLQVQMALPYVYQPFLGQHILIGMSFFNSDYGAGTFSVSPSIMDIDRGFSMVFPSMSFDSTINKELFKKIHLGPALKPSDLNTMNSDRARRVDEVAELMREAMQRRLSKEFCEAICKAIDKAHRLEMSWGSIRRQLFSVLLKEELDQLELQLKARDSKLPPLKLDDDGLPIPSAWWAAQAVASLAAETPNPDRKIELQHEAGRFVGLK